MQHNRAGRKLRRTTPHRLAMFSNQLASLMTHERIETTLTKAKELRPLAEKLYVDQVYEFFTVNLGRALAAFLARTVDQRVIDGAVNGVAELVGDAARSGRRLQSGLVRSYALGVLGGAVLIVAFLVFRP